MHLKAQLYLPSSYTCVLRLYSTTAIANLATLHLKVWLRKDEFTERWGDSAAYQALRQASRARKAARAAAAAAGGAGATSVHPDARPVT